MKRLFGIARQIKRSDGRGVQKGIGASSRREAKDGAGTLRDSTRLGDFVPQIHRR